MVRVITILILTVLSLGWVCAQTTQASRSARDYYRSGAAHLRANEFDAALADFDKALELNPNLADALFYRIITLKHLKPGVEPLKDYDRMIELAPNYPLIDEIYLSRANFRAAVGQNDGALDDVNKVLAINSENSMAYWLRSFAYMSKGDLERSRVDFEKTISLQPNSHPPLIARGHALRINRNFEGALADYTKAIEWRPDDAVGYVDRAILYVLVGKIELALNDIKKGLSLDPESVSERSPAAWGCPSCGLNVYMERHPDDPRSYEARGILRSLQHHDAEAKYDFARSAQLAPDLKVEIEQVMAELRSWN